MDYKILELANQCVRVFKLIPREFHQCCLKGFRSRGILEKLSCCSLLRFWRSLKPCLREFQLRTFGRCWRNRCQRTMAKLKLSWTSSLRWRCLRLRRMRPSRGRRVLPSSTSRRIRRCPTRKSPAWSNTMRQRGRRVPKWTKQSRKRCSSKRHIASW